MKVLHLIESMGHGGAEWLIVEHVRHAGPGVESLVCAVNRGGAALEAAAALGARTFVLEKAERRWATLQRLRRMLRDEGVDVVNGHNPVGGLYAALASFGARPSFGRLSRSRNPVDRSHATRGVRVPGGAGKSRTPHALGGAALRHRGQRHLVCTAHPRA
jgi:hypothetical protein